MEEHRLIRIDGSRIVTTARARRYLSGNLSMIHDERKIPIFDMVSRRTVGTLDESFVVGWVHTGAVFITKGQLWRVLEIDDGRLTVEPAKKAIGELPSWEGEQIPVPFAGRTGSRGDPARSAPPGSIQKKKRASRLPPIFSRRWRRTGAKSRPTGSSRSRTSMTALSAMSAPATRQTRRSGRVLSILISARYGTTVGIELDAYRILLRLPSAIRAADVRDFLLSLEPAHMPGILRLALKRTALFKWKLVQIAKKFGAIDPDADYEKISIHRLLDYFDNTVVQQEAYRELLSGYMDVDAAAQVVSEVKEGIIGVAIGPHSLIGADGILSSRDQIPPPTADQAVLATLKRRLEQDDVVLACMNCRDWKSQHGRLAGTGLTPVPEVRCPSHRRAQAV